ncbi:MAG: site-2 protease family protein [Kiritimatiellae bacterium]|nr:site-2 protease family protein [Kiritimatiellia bacterium]MCO5068494.1 site-2 protease family protein [Kiritimatiellia bacterium]
MSFFISRIAEDPFYVVSWIVIVTFSICVHEFAHAWTALRLGDDTAAREGHLSLNPLIQMGWMSLMLLALFGIAWGAVPVDPRRLRTAARAAWVAAAGPLANLLLAFVFSGLMVAAATLLPESSRHVPVYFFRFAAVANGVLCLFNLLPLPMFDGWTVMAAVIPPLRAVDPARVQSLSWLALFAVFATPTGAWLWKGGSLLAGKMMLGWSHLALLAVG